MPDAYGSGVNVDYLALHRDVCAADPDVAPPEGDGAARVLPAAGAPHGPPPRIPVLCQLERRVRQVRAPRGPPARRVSMPASLEA